ncbi:MAG: beta-ketoacyl-ACP synthase II [Actinobacteria bacterium]|nr:beta-ketoacyl-ACP synthase II [Actinomycetota bacterium]MCL6095521.1 beta-ketoacyl-ACP synthase II [Actinomycetota bacterium]
MVPAAGDTNSQSTRVVITGLGVVATCGIGKDAFFDGLCSPAPSGPRRVNDFDPSQWFGPKEVRRVDRFAQFAVASAQMALDDAGPLKVDPDRAGVSFGTGMGGLESLENQTLMYAERGPEAGAKRISPFLIPMTMPNSAAANISMRFGWHGPSETITTACAAGTHAVAAGASLIKSGRCDVVITGGAEAVLTAVSIAAFTNMTAISTTGIARPFDIRRDGFVPAEGGAAILLESLEHALARDAHIYGELVGSASTSDAYHITAPAPGGAGAARCMELALISSGLTPSDIAHINAHGTSTPLNDLAEAEAINKVFGIPGPPVTSIKGVTGHALGAAGALEAVAVAMTIERRLIPPTAGYEEPDPEIHLDIVYGAPRAWDPGPVLSNSFGFGGHNGCIVLTPPAD